MPEYEFSGESLEAAFHHPTKSKRFEGVVVYQFIGTEADIKASTDLLQAMYPSNEKTTLSDAQCIASTIDDHQVYSLVVMLKESK